MHLRQARYRSDRISRRRYVNSSRIPWLWYGVRYILQQPWAMRTVKAIHGGVLLIASQYSPVQPNLRDRIYSLSSEATYHRLQRSFGFFQ